MTRLSSLPTNSVKHTGRRGPLSNRLRTRNALRFSIVVRYTIVTVVAVAVFGVALYSLRQDPSLAVHSNSLLQTMTISSSISQSSSQNKKQSSLHATVMGMAYNYDVGSFKPFVGSLRRSGFQGKIILGVSQEPKEGVEAYLTSQNVTMKRLKMVDCAIDIVGRNVQNKGKELDSNQKEVMTCADPHPDLKIRWGRFALLKDYLEECHECTGPVLVSDLRDTFFQRDPFGPEAPPVEGLQVFEEHRKQRTTHWLVQFPVEKCKKKKPIFDEVMLCSGTTIGTREAMLRYLQDMVTEMRAWMKDEDCCCNEMSGDDQAIHNWLYYSGGLPYATAKPNRMGLVNTVGVQGAIIGRTKRKRLMAEKNIDEGQADSLPYTSEEDEAKGMWLGEEYDQTDQQGYFLDFNGERSFIIHQFDRYGHPLYRWLMKHGPCKGL